MLKAEVRIDAYVAALRGALINIRLGAGTGQNA